MGSFSSLVIRVMAKPNSNMNATEMMMEATCEVPASASWRPESIKILLSIE